MLLFLLAATLLATQSPASGEYGPLKLAFADGRVTGAFSETRMGNGTEKAPQFSCGFALVGAWRGQNSAAEVLTWWPGQNPPDERIRGRLTVRDGKATLELDEDPGGCVMTGDSFKTSPFTEQLSTRRQWLEVRQVRSAHAHFRDAPGGSPRRGYVTAGDIVGVTARVGNFVQVQYVDGSMPTQGWLPLSDLEPRTP